MRLLFILLFSAAMNLQAQVVSTEYILSGTVQSTSQVNKSNIKVPAFYVRMEFGSDSVLNPAVIDSIKKYHIDRIELVYSAYATSAEFSQKMLNQKRLEALAKLYPALFDNNVIQWQLIKQTSATSADSARKLFHGFIVYTVNRKVFTKDKNPTSLTTEAEIKIIKEELGYGKSTTMEPVVVLDSESDGYDTAAYKKAMYKASETYVNHFRDSVVLNYFHLNKMNLTPDKIILVEDVTDSMYPYTTQTFMWRRIHTDKIQHYIFFNDGNNKPDNQKYIGKTGGVYYFNSAKTADLEEKIFDVMRKGNGGDCPENNAEALLAVSKYCPDCEFVLMIADNYAPVKDISLVKEIKKPVHIILCGYNGTVQESYIRLAYETGGSIHTMNKTLVKFDRLEEGAIVQVGAQKFLFKNGKFLLTR